LKVGQNSEIREKLTQLESLLTGIGRGIPCRTCLINEVIAEVDVSVNLLGAD